MTLQEYRNSIGLTQKQMSEALGIHQPGLARAEKNWPLVSAEFLTKLVMEYRAPIIIDFPGGARFLEPGEVVTAPHLEE
jgi:transcriptional regulator with XRE-family HTH domain